MSLPRIGHYLGLVFLCLCNISLVACYPIIYTSKTINLTHEPRFHGGYNTLMTYELKRPLLYDGQSGVGDYFYWPGISSGRRVDYGNYINDKASYPKITVIPKGTKFKFIKMILTVDPWIGQRESLYGEFLDGPIEGTKFDLIRISTCYVDKQWKPRKTEYKRGYEVSLRWPDPKYVTKIRTGTLSAN